jgi:hypothetical protein
VRNVLVLVGAGSPDGGFITGSDFLMDGGVTAAYWYGELNISPSATSGVQR